MGEALQSLLLGRRAAEQCRREIAAAWEQIEAGRGILVRSRWLLLRWAEQARRAVQPPSESTGRARRPMGGEFVPVETEAMPEASLKERGGRWRRRRVTARSKTRSILAAGRDAHSSAGSP
jgi:hypothetical protein